LLALVHVTSAINYISYYAFNQLKIICGWTIIIRDNCIAALVLRCNCTFALVFLTLHVCPWFSKLKALFAPVCQHRELDLNNCSKKISQKKKKGEKTILPLIPNTLLPSPSGSPTRESPPACRRAGLRPPPPHGPEPPRALPARLRRAVRHHQHDAAGRRKPAGAVWLTKQRLGGGE